MCGDCDRETDTFTRTSKWLAGWLGRWRATPVAETAVSDTAAVPPPSSRRLLSSLTPGFCARPAQARYSGTSKPPVDSTALAPAVAHCVYVCGWMCVGVVDDVFDFEDFSFCKGGREERGEFDCAAVGRLIGGGCIIWGWVVSFCFFLGRGWF